MANSIERLFDEVLPTLLEQSDSDNFPPPDYPEHDEQESFQDSPDDTVESMEQRNVADEVVSRIFNPGDDTYPKPDEEERKIVEGGIRHSGFEVLAFYKSRRFQNQRPYPGKWGIFYIDHGISHVKFLISANYPGYGNPKELAIEFLRQHERFHFQFDVQTLSAEAAAGHQLYEPLKRAFSKHRIYIAEEALANQQAWNWAKQQRIGIEDFASDFMSIQPGAYARFEEPKIELAAELAANLHERRYHPSVRRHDLAPWVGLLPKNLLRASLCPEWVVHLAALNRWITPAFRLPDIKQINDSEKVTKSLTGRLINYKAKWEKVKVTLLTSPELLLGRRFKIWDATANVWSVQVDSNYRAHLVFQGNGNWLTVDLDNHKTMGHG